MGDKVLLTDGVTWGGEAAVELFNLMSGAKVNVGTLITDALFAVCAVILFGDFRRQARSVALCVVEAILVYALENALWLAFNFALGLEANTAPSLPALAAALAVYALTQTHLALDDRIVRYATFMASFVIVVGMTGIILAAIPALKSLSFFMAIPSAFSYVAMLGFALVLRRFSIARFRFVPRHFTLLVLLTDLLGVVMSYSFIHYTRGFREVATYSYAANVLGRFEQSVSFVNLVVNLSFLLLMLVSYVMFYVLAREHDSRAELLVTKKSDIDALNQMRVTQSMYDSLRKVRHELKNHDAYMSALLEDENYDLLREYFAQYRKENRGLLSYVSSGNMSVDAVVNAKVAIARDQGIEVKTMLAVPSELPFEEADVFRLLANLLDNAIEGAELSQADEKVIKLRVVPKAGYWFFFVSNPCDPGRVRRTRTGRLLTTKGDREIHGYGTKIVSDIAEKYHGTASFQVVGETFESKVMLMRDLEEEEG